MKETLGEPGGRVDCAVVATALMRVSAIVCRSTVPPRASMTTSMVGIRWAHACVLVGSATMGKTEVGGVGHFLFRGRWGSGNVPSSAASCLAFASERVTPYTMCPALLRA